MQLRQRPDHRSYQCLERVVMSRSRRGLCAQYFARIVHKGHPVSAFRDKVHKLRGKPIIGVTSCVRSRSSRISSRSFRDCSRVRSHKLNGCGWFFHGVNWSRRTSATSARRLDPLRRGLNDGAAHHAVAANEAHWGRHPTGLVHAAHDAKAAAWAFGRRKQLLMFPIHAVVDLCTERSLKCES